MQKISIIIPAHNEEKYLAKCLDSIGVAASKIALPVEIIVSLNRCTDNTEGIAKHYGAITVHEERENIARIRNAGVNISTGDVVATIDADSRMTPNMLQEVIRHLQTGQYIGGGVEIRPERISIGMLFSLMMLLPYLLKARVSGGMFWLYKSDFEAIGGFDEGYVSAEDYHFARKLKAYGRQKGLRYGTITKAHIVTSCRKFDQWGDWYLFKNPKLVKDLFEGHNQQKAEEFYYHAKRWR
jgi:glycosyltransferase involved in cell wall biosynthesis